MKDIEGNKKLKKENLVTVISDLDMA